MKTEIVTLTRKIHFRIKYETAVARAHIMRDLRATDGHTIITAVGSAPDSSPYSCSRMKDKKGKK